MLCDGKLDCPDGDDEQFCSDMVCPGLLLCRYDNLCIHPVNMCDGIIHCPISSDDESSCGSWECPIGCSCRGYVVRCQHHFLDIHSATRAVILRFVVIPHTFTLMHASRLFHADLSSNQFTGNVINCVMFKKMRHIKILLLTNSTIQQIRKCAFKDLINLVTLHLLENTIHIFDSTTWNTMKQLVHLVIHNISIKHVNPYNFRGLDRIVLLNLSLNSISYIQRGAFSGVDKLTVLDLRYNPLESVDYEAFLYVTNIQLVHYHKSMICCYVSNNQQCVVNDTMLPNTKSCPNILNNPRLENFYIATAIVLLLVIAIGVTFQRESSKLHSHVMLVNHVCVVDCLFLVFILVLSVMSIIFRNNFMYVQVKWNTSFVCSIMQLLIICGVLLSKFTVLLIAINHLIVTKYALQNTQVFFSANRIVFILSILWSIGLVVSLVNFIRGDLNTGACLIFVTPSTSIMYNVGFALIIGLLFVVTVSIMIIYYQLTKFVKLSAEKTRSTQNKSAVYNKLVHNVIRIGLNETATFIGTLYVSLRTYDTSISGIDILVVVIVYIFAMLHFVNYIVVAKIQRSHAKKFCSSKI